MWLGKLTAFDMTPLGWLGRKTSTQTKIELNFYPKTSFNHIQIQIYTYCDSFCSHWEPSSDCDLDFVMSRDLHCLPPDWSLVANKSLQLLPRPKSSQPLPVNHPCPLPKHTVLHQTPLHSHDNSNPQSQHRTHHSTPQTKPPLCGDGVFCGAVHFVYNLICLKMLDESITM